MYPLHVPIYCRYFPRFKKHIILKNCFKFRIRDLMKKDYIYLKSLKVYGLSIYNEKKYIVHNYCLEMSLWASPSEAVHHLRNVVGDNSDGMIIYSTLHLRYMIFDRFLRNLYMSSKLAENLTKTPKIFKLECWRASFPTQACT